MSGSKKSQPRRDQLLEQATMLFSTNGFDGTSMRMIARASNITEAAIYRHFDNKAHLYEEVIRAKAEVINIDQLILEGDPNEEIESVLSRMAHHILELAARDPQLMRLMFHNSLERGSFSALLFMEVRLPYIEFLANQLMTRMKSGELREIDPYITSRCFVGMVMDCALNIGVWTKLTDLQFEAGDVVCNNVPIFARGLLAEGVS